MGGNNPQLELSFSSPLTVRVVAFRAHAVVIGLMIVSSELQL